MKTQQYLPLCIVFVIFASVEVEGRRMEKLCRKLYVSPQCPDLPGIPNVAGHRPDQAKPYVYQLYPLVKTGCSAQLAPFLCRLYFPQCSLTEAVSSYRSVCLQTRSGCQRLMSKYGITWPEALDCHSLPETDQREMKTSSSKDFISSYMLADRPISGRRGPPSSKRSGGSVSRCVPFTSEFCPKMPYAMTGFPNLLNHNNPGQAYKQLKMLTALMESGCSLRLQDFLCGVHFPECNEGKLIAPCRSVCLEVRTSCQEVLSKMGFQWPEQLRCNKFPTGDSCFGKGDQPIVVLPGLASSGSTVVARRPLSGHVDDDPSEAVIRPAVKMLNSTIFDPVLAWLVSSTELNHQKQKLVHEQVEIARLNEQKISLEITRLKKSPGGAVTSPS